MYQFDTIINDNMYTNYLQNLENYKLQNFRNLFFPGYLIVQQKYTKCLKKIYDRCQHLNPGDMLFAPIRNIKICKKTALSKSFNQNFY